MVAMGYVISAKPDGYTLGSSMDGDYMLAPHLMKLDYNPLTDTTPIILYGTVRGALFVRSDSPFKTFKDVMDFARANPGKLTYGCGAFGQIPYLAMMAAALEAGVEISPVQFPGGAQSMTALLGGHVMTAQTTIDSILPQERAGKVRIIAVQEGRERVKSLSQWPTFYECGVKTPIPVSGMIIYGQKGLPDPIVKKLADAFSKGSEAAIFKKFALEHEIYPIEGGPETGQKLLNFLNTGAKDCKDLMLKAGVIKTESK
jgi:tripartite-type tricarboxylate transporter receptor subunit TctC